MNTFKNLDNFHIFDLIKCKYTVLDDGYNNRYAAILASPAKGLLYITENSPRFISGQVRMRGRDGGRYPYNYLEMIDYIFGRETNTIEVCSGSIKGRNVFSSADAPFTVDINPSMNPDYVGDAQVLEGIANGTYSRWLCDPPYNARTAKEMYGTDLPNPSKLLNAGARVCKPGSLMFLLLGPQNYQIHPKGVKRIGYIDISVVPNNEIRCLNIYYKLADI
jgi:hypothetical protein